MSVRFAATAITACWLSTALGCGFDLAALRSGDAAVPVDALVDAPVDAPPLDASRDAEPSDAAHDAFVDHDGGRDACAAEDPCGGGDDDCDGSIDEDACPEALECRRGACRAPVGSLRWEQVASSSADDGIGRDRARAVSRAADGFVVVGDWSGGTLTLGEASFVANAQDVFAVTLGFADGAVVDAALVDAMAIGGAASDEGLGVSSSTGASSGSTVVGRVGGTVSFGSAVTTGPLSGFVARYGTPSSLTPSAITRLPASSTVRAVATSGEDAIVAGALEASVSWGGCAVTVASGTSRAFVARVRGDGSVAWCTSWDGEGIASANAVAVDGGEVFVAGAFEGRLELTTSVESRGFDAFVGRLDADTGTLRWAVVASGNGVEEGSAIGLHGDHVYFGGAHASAATELSRDGAVLGSLPPASDLDAFVVALGRDGALRWTRTSAGTFESRVRGLAAVEGELFVMGEHGGVSWSGCSAAGAGARDVFVASLAADDGACRWVRSHGGPADDLAGGVAVDEDLVVIVGAINDGAVVDGTAWATVGEDAAGRDTDVYVAAYAW
ncbi:MAG: PQQ-like beta-propeller repeat protein [Sandaracinus sp.]|nr:PQQ-like beta-propeller repeat protein [Sandaracinus sp.]MCB9618143.1 PQQ-like beta-propeller repeat protein [Sandaracinus sp.]MCB9624144.1 PQQ-like beta-propeller repeat protein [Sandaracinus sp.]MCB9636521.1 PQQ-like beta-propeller repeat protein [Sandaracinus sp.]